MAQPERIVATLDVGNQRILALIGELDDRGVMVIRGVGTAPSAGMRFGQVVHLKPVVEAIRAAVEEAELMARLPVERVWASVAGTFISGRTTRSAITLGTREREVTMRDLEALHDAVRQQPLPPGHMVLNVFTHAYTLDDQQGILDPQEMVGRQLALDAYVLACQQTPVRTLEKAINEAGVAVEEFVFAPVAAGQAALTADERRLGAVLVDVGFGNTTYAAFSSDQLLVAGCFPLAGSKFNDDLVHRFQTTTAGAEKVKREAGSVMLEEIGAEETLAVPTIDGRSTHVVSRREVCQTMRFRAEEIFELVLADISREVSPESPFTGVVLCGGSADLTGLVPLAEQIFVKRARMAELEGVVDATQLLDSSELPSRSPSVAVGLLAHARSQILPDARPVVRVRHSRGNALSSLFRSIFTKKEVENDHV